MALTVPFSIPVVGDRPFVSSGGARLNPRLVADWRSPGRYTVAANVGYRQTVGGGAAMPFPAERLPGALPEHTRWAGAVSI